VAPQLSNTPEGNLLIIEMAEKLNQNKVQVAQLAREYLRKNSRYDEGFYDEVRLVMFLGESQIFPNAKG
jgi:hypothetical protein